MRRSTTPLVGAETRIVPVDLHHLLHVGADTDQAGDIIFLALDHVLAAQPDDQPFVIDPAPPVDVDLVAECGQRVLPCPLISGRPSDIACRSAPACPAMRVPSGDKAGPSNSGRAARLDRRGLSRRRAAGSGRRMVSGPHSASCPSASSTRAPSPTRPSSVPHAFRSPHAGTTPQGPTDTDYHRNDGRKGVSAFGAVYHSRSGAAAGSVRLNRMVRPWPGAKLPTRVAATAARFRQAGRRAAVIVPGGRGGQSCCPIGAAERPCRFGQRDRIERDRHRQPAAPRHSARVDQQAVRHVHHRMDDGPSARPGQAGIGAAIGIAQRDRPMSACAIARPRPASPIVPVPQGVPRLWRHAGRGRRIAAEGGQRQAARSHAWTPFRRRSPRVRTGSARRQTIEKGAVPGGIAQLDS